MQVHTSSLNMESCHIPVKHLFAPPLCCGPDPPVAVSVCGSLFGQMSPVSKDVVLTAGLSLTPSVQIKRNSFA